MCIPKFQTFEFLFTVNRIVLFHLFVEQIVRCVFQISLCIYRNRYRTTILSQSNQINNSGGDEERENNYDEVASHYSFRYVRRSICTSILYDTKDNKSCNNITNVIHDAVSKSYYR
jgi:hypothetical protein